MCDNEAAGHKTNGLGLCKNKWFAEAHWVYGTSGSKIWSYSNKNLTYNKGNSKN